MGPTISRFQAWGGLRTVGDCLPLGDISGGCGQLIRLIPQGTSFPIANLRAYELLHNPDGAHAGETNPYAVLALSGERLATDAAGNDLLRVAPDGEISILAVFPQRWVDAPPSLGLPPGAQIGVHTRFVQNKPRQYLRYIGGELRRPCRSRMSPEISMLPITRG